ncbi:nuclear transport factor 2 family protein [Fulvivirgaceae bacterium PWU20]|uniref:Nuclear transport factor 2 family protein n=2 Tax=Chryseosolibacter indicus TaxID=2782351 RepID=A0ABS5VUF0_9BACT|nr:nuclear transport factor 2 family protein [Chryseosolibacter indicus]
MAFLQSRGIKFLNTGIAVFIPILLGVSLLTQQDVLGQVAYTSFRGEAEKPSTLTLYKENESLEVVTRFLEAVKEKNHAKAAPLLDSLIEWHQPGDNRYSGVKKNANEVFVMFKGFIETSANSLQLSDVKTIAVNGNSVACLLHWNAVTPHGARLDVDNIDVYTVAGGKITRCIVYSTDLEQENKFWWK